MKKKIGWIILAVALVVLIGGASVLYNKYSGEVENERLMTEDSTQAVIEENTSEKDDTGENTSETAENTSDTGESAEETAEESAEEELMLAPDFTVYDADGNAVNLSDFIGKPTVVNFWASWCGPCQMEMPDFDKKYKELGEEIHFLMVNMTDGSQETLETAKAFVEKSGYSFPVYYDTDIDAAMTYGVSSIPSTFFIDAEGHAVAWAQGMIDAETLQKGIDMITE
ncbi:MAG: TlpA family protein disulfide reductase [Lachnospiraceae bacterium]|nr:TlpA family protein disulfide reductase [Lachnospiraceae bacterium]